MSASHAAPIRTLVADDEPLARDLLCRLLANETDFLLVGEATSGADCLRAVTDLKPDLLLLDIAMPNLDGMAVAEHLYAANAAPYTVFVTAHDEFALPAYAYAVRDYLVKPIRKADFTAALARARMTILNGDRAKTPTSPSIRFRTGDRLHSINVDDIAWIRADSQYARVYLADGESHLVARSLRQFARDLPAGRFIRIHRSTMVALAYVNTVERVGGQYRVRLHDTTEHTIARSRQSVVDTLLRHKDRRPTR